MTPNTCKKCTESHADDFRKKSRGLYPRTPSFWGTALSPPRKGKLGALSSDPNGRDEGREGQATPFKVSGFAHGAGQHCGQDSRRNLHAVSTGKRWKGDLGLILRGIYHGGLATRLGKHQPVKIKIQNQAMMSNSKFYLKRKILIKIFFKSLNSGLNKNERIKDNKYF